MSSTCGGSWSRIWCSTGSIDFCVTRQRASAPCSRLASPLGSSSGESGTSVAPMVGTAQKVSSSSSELLAARSPDEVIALRRAEPDQLVTVNLGNAARVH